jgi:hypothetical protein
MIWVTLIIGIFIAWASSTAYALISNYFIARRTGLPLLITPINPDSLLWNLTSGFLSQYLEPILPNFLDGMIANTYGWEYRDKYKIHQRVGSTFLLVTPGEMECWTADPEVAQIVLTRRKDFIQMPLSNVVVGMCGPNLLSVRAFHPQSQSFERRIT